MPTAEATLNELFMLIEENRTDDVRQLLQQNDIDVHATGQNGNSALTHALVMRNPEALALLLKAPSYEKNKYHENCTLLYTICKLAANCHYRNKDQKLIELLLQHGEDPNLPLKSNNPCMENFPLHLLAETEYINLTKTLINGGANINQINGMGKSPLSMQLSRNNIDEESVKELIKRGADLSHQECYRSLRQIAKSNHHTAILKYLPRDFPLKPHMRSAQGNFIALAKLLGYPSIPPGLCNGMTNLFIHATLINDEETCIKRFYRIRFTTPEKVFADVKAAQKKRLALYQAYKDLDPTERETKINENLTDCEIIDLDIPAAYDFMMQYQYRFTFNRYRYLSDLLFFINHPKESRHQIEARTMSKKMDEMMNAQEKIDQNSYPEIYSGMTNGIYTIDELKKYFSSLQDAFNSVQPKLSEPVAFHFTSSDHAIALSYHPEKNIWRLLDINTTIRDHKDTDSLAEHAFQCLRLGNELSPYLFIKNNIATTPKGKNALEACLEQWMKNPIYTELHALTSEKTHRIDRHNRPTHLRDQAFSHSSRMYWNGDYSPHLKTLRDMRSSETKTTSTIFAISGLIAMASLTACAIGFFALTFALPVTVSLLTIAAIAAFASAAALIYRKAKDNHHHAHPEKADTTSANRQNAQIWRVLAENHPATVNDTPKSAIAEAIPSPSTASSNPENNDQSRPTPSLAVRI